MSKDIEKTLLTLVLLEALDEEKDMPNRRGPTRGWVKRREEKGYYSNLVKELRMEDTQGYKEMMRMNYNTFLLILQEIEQDITVQELTNGGCKRIMPAERLTLTLRYLATGESYSSLSFQFRISKRAISYIVQEVCSAISKNLMSVYLSVPKTEEEWMRIADEFNERWNFPNAIGAIDGKHIILQRPFGGGSHFYNYKCTHSIVLMAIAGPNYECLYADIGANGRCSDGGIWGNSRMSKCVEDNTLNIPAPRKLPNSDIATPFVFLGDDAFALKSYMMKPFPQRGLDVEKRIYNYRHSRARRISENLFGILASRWRVLRSAFLLQPKSVENIIMAILILHNYLRRSSSVNDYCPPDLIDSDIRGEFKSGSWREDCNGSNQSYLPLESQRGKTASNAKLVRETLAEYFLDEGVVPWQWENC